MVLICLVGALLAAGLALLLWLGGRPAYYRGVSPGELGRFLNTLLQYSTTGSILVIEHEGSPRALKFLRYLDDNQNPRLKLAFLDTDSLREYFPKVEEALRSAGMEFEVKQTGLESCPRFIEVSGLQDTAQAVDLALLLLASMGLGDNDRYRVHCLGGFSREGARLHLQEKKAEQESRGLDAVAPGLSVPANVMWTRTERLGYNLGYHLNVAKQFLENVHLWW